LLNASSCHLPPGTANNEHSRLQVEKRPRHVLSVRTTTELLPQWLLRSSVVQREYPPCSLSWYWKLWSAHHLSRWPSISQPPHARLHYVLPHACENLVDLKLHLRIARGVPSAYQWHMTGSWTSSILAQAATRVDRPWSSLDAPKACRSLCITFTATHSMSARWKSDPVRGELGMFILFFFPDPNDSLSLKRTYYSIAPGLHLCRIRHPNFKL
jgi:hypothetical protein